MITVIGGIKGGCGKTTLATNLCVLSSQKGEKVLLVDTDEQQSAALWAHQREESGIKTEWTTISLFGTSVRSQILKMAKDYDSIIIDSAGRDTVSQRAALTIADIYLVPFQPRSYDIWTLGQVIKLINDVSAINEKLRSYAIINCGDPQGQDNAATMEIIKEYSEIICIPSVIHKRKIFANAATEGLGITETKFIDKKANEEIRNVYEYIYGTQQKDSYHMDNIRINDIQGVHIHDC